MTGIYKIENILTGEVYIGQSKNIERRWQQHRENMVAKTTVRKYGLYRDMRYWGIKNFSFDVLEECSQFALDEREAYWIRHYAAKVHCYNIKMPEGVERR